MAWCLAKHRDNFTFTFTEIHGVVSGLDRLTDVHISQIVQSTLKSLNLLSISHYICTL
jgi:hypothetical protein